MKNILLLHGALGSKEQFTRILEPLSQNFQVHTLSFEGHGGKTSGRPFTISAFSENVIQFLDENKLEAISIFGYSMGGYVGLNLAIHYPERIREVVTLGTKLKWNPEIAAGEMKMLNPEKIEEKVPQFASQLKERHHPQDWKVLMLKTADLLKHLGNGKAMTDFDFKRITCPVTLGIGSKDHMVTIEEQRYVQSCITDSQVIVLDEVKHVLESISTQALIGYIGETIR